MPRPNSLTPQLDLSFEPPRPSRRVWPVRELVGQVRELVEQEFGDVWVEGEISNFRLAPSGHVYFTLKDADAQLPAVLFRRQALLLRFRPEDGLHVLVRGRVSVYEQRGQMQLVAETMEPVGAGSLQLAFEQLKQKLKAEGLFEAERKRPLPAFPRTVGIVTSPTGAVIRDFLNIVSRRHSGLNVLLFPASVQGDSAAAEVEAALAQLNASGLVDVIVLARGGHMREPLPRLQQLKARRALQAMHLPGNIFGNLVLRLGDQLAGGRGRGRAQVGHKVGDGEIGLVPNGRDHRTARRSTGAGHALGVECGQVLK